MRKGQAAVPVLVILTMVGLGYILQLNQGITPGEAITGVAIVVVLAIQLLTYRRQDRLEQNIREAEQRSQDSRRQTHERIDRLLSDLSERFEAAAQERGRLMERTDHLREQHKVQEERVNSIGSKIAAQHQLHLDGTREILINRLDAQDRRIDEMRR